MPLGIDYVRAASRKRLVVWFSTHASKPAIMESGTSRRNICFLGFCEKTTH